jgi:chaperonin GroES
MKIHPTADYVVVQAETAEEVRASGIVLPDTASKDRPQQGKVLAIGPECKNITKGDVVLFTTYSPKEVKIDDEEYLLLKEEDILATVK